MKGPIVCNATPIIAFSRINRLELFRQITGTITIPQEVEKELYEHGRTDVPALDRSNWINVRKVQSRAGVELLLPSLDKGEAEVIVLSTVRTLKVVDDQIGSPTYTYDLAAAVKRLVEDGAGGVFHVTNGGSCSWYEFARAILEEAGLANVEVLPIKSDEFPRPAKRPCFSVLDGTKFYKTTGIAIRPWRMALRDCLPKMRA